MPVPQQRSKSNIVLQIRYLLSCVYCNCTLSKIVENSIVLKTVYAFNKEKTVKMLCLLAKASTSTQTRRKMDVGCQTDPSQLRSVGTQLSFTTLQAKYRSTGLLMFLMLFVLNSRHCL